MGHRVALTNPVDVATIVCIHTFNCLQVQHIRNKPIGRQGENSTFGIWSYAARSGVSFPLPQEGLSVSFTGNQEPPNNRSLSNSIHVKPSKSLNSPMIPVFTIFRIWSYTKRSCQPLGSNRSKKTEIIKIIWGSRQDMEAEKAVTMQRWHRSRSIVLSQRLEPIDKDERRAWWLIK